MPKISLKQIDADLVLQSDFDTLDSNVTTLSGLHQSDMDDLTSAMVTLEDGLTTNYETADSTLSGILSQQIEEASNLDPVKDFSIAMAVAL